MFTIFRLSILICLLYFSSVSLAQDALQQHVQINNTDNNYFTVRFVSKLKPIAINTMHAWIIQIQNNKNEIISNADISVKGGMPEHDHGLPTRPQVTKYLGDGCYLLEGMKFHMGGWWTITFIITQENISDTVTFELNL